ncbi:MAG TPA: flavin reductase family protein, partial [Phaeodactylibacter sp.]|nr:flavin reductase family protein [Phaeodactylibacter sp.]
MRIVDPKQTPTPDMHQYLLGAVAPRPIAFASTIDKNGNPNIAPYSFFNAFSSNPPILIFSSNRRVADNSTKDTLHNIEQTGEVVINVVNYAIVRQMAIASISFPPEVNEFKKAGLTPI